MKKYILFAITLMFFVFKKSPAQEAVLLDTIYANDTKNVALFFPNPIRQGLTGSDNFVFTFNREKEQHLGLLQAKPGKESNLLVINTNGSIFSYIVASKAELSKLNYFIPKSSSIGNENGSIDLDLDIKHKPKAPIDKVHYYERFCSYLLNAQRCVALKRKRTHGVVLSLEKIVFDKDELYFVIEIENNSSMDYDLNFLNLSLETRQKGKKKSLQRIYKAPLFRYQVPSRIREGFKTKLVYVMPKFSISNERRAILELNEKDGERNIKLKIPHRMISNPN